MKEYKTIILLGVASLLLIIGIGYTRSRLVANIDGTVNATLAKWNITINNTVITQTITDAISLGDIEWTNSHANPNKVAPGSTGVVDLVIDPQDTQVSFRFDITFTDHTQDNEILLTITNMSANGVNLIRTGERTYTGIFALSEIEAGTTKTITINIAWLNDEANNEHDTNVGTEVESGKLIGIKFVAKQYKGETINEYIPPVTKVVFVPDSIDATYSLNATRRACTSEEYEVLGESSGYVCYTYTPPSTPVTVYNTSTNYCVSSFGYYSHDGYGWSDFTTNNSTTLNSTYHYVEITSVEPDQSGNPTICGDAPYNPGG